MRPKIAFAASLLLLAMSARAEGTLTRDDVQTLFVEPVAVALETQDAPNIDAKLDDAVWQKADALRFGFADPGSPGYPKNKTDVRIACDGKALYVAFNCIEMGAIKANTKDINHERLPEDDHVTLLLLPEGNRWTTVKQGSPHLLLKVNPNGTPWMRILYGLDPDARPGKPIDIEGLETKAAQYPGRWAAEIKIPFSGLYEDVSKVPALMKANFFRQRYDKRYGVVQTGDPGHANWTLSWKPSAALEPYCPHHGNFGMLYIPTAPAKPGKIADLKPGAGARAAQKAEDPGAAPVPGFDVTPAELEGQLNDGPFAFVPDVETPPDLEQGLADPAWQKARPLALKYMDEFVEGPVEKNRTHVKVLADKEHLYFGFECEEDFMKEIRADCDGVDPGDLWLDDSIDVFLDPGRTLGYTYFQFGFNTKGAYRKSRTKNVVSWNPESLKIRTWRHDKGWSAILRVSFADLGVKPDLFPKWWGVNFYRVRYARRPSMDETPGVENWDTAWRANPMGSPHQPEYFGNLLFQRGKVLNTRLFEYFETKGLNKKLGLAQQRPAVEEATVPLAPPPTDPTFATAPAAEKDGENVAVTFAADSETDVEIAVLDAAGKVVRHLAGGKLGKNAPPPLQAGSLKQRIVWDRTGDDGKKLPEGAYKIRVGLGLRGSFERTIGWKPGIGNVRGLAVAPGGELIVLSGSSSVDHGWADSAIAGYGRDGKYKRQLYPFSSAVPLEKMKGVQPIALADGTWIPVVYQALNHSWLPFSPALSRQQPAVTPDGYLVLANMCMRGMGHGRRLLKIGLDGSAPADFLGPQISRYALGGEMYIAVSPDGKWFYVTGLKGASLWSEGEYHCVVYRMRWDEPELRADFRAPFIGEFLKPGSDAKHLNNPTGIAVDASGNIYVADRGNDRIAVYSPEGQPLKQIALPGAARVAVHPKTGAIYALATGKGAGLVKLKSLADPSEAARVAVKAKSENLALDAGVEPAVLYAGDGQRFTDNGAALTPAGDVAAAQQGKPFDERPASFGGNLMYVDKATEEIYVGKWDVFDGATGAYKKRIDLRAKGTGDWGGEIAVGSDRHFYMRGNNGLWRFDPSGKSVPFANGKLEIPDLFGGHGNSNRGHCVAPNGDVYFVHHYYPHGNTQVTVSQVGVNGEVKRYQFIENKYTSGSGIAVDREGHIYLGLAVKPWDVPYPEFFKGRLPDTGIFAEPWFFYRQMYGSVVKFKPEGGKVVKDDNGPLTATNYSHFHRARIDGALWTYYGYSPMHQKDIQSSRCNCESARFDLDGYGRLFIPDAMRNSVVVIDSNANELARIGSYGNMDARGPGSPAPKPDVGMAWPLVVFATDTAMYVGDTINNRVLKVKLERAAETTVAAP